MQVEEDLEPQDCNHITILPGLQPGCNHERKVKKFGLAVPTSVLFSAHLCSLLISNSAERTEFKADTLNTI